MVSGSIFAEGGHLCQAACTMISRAASVPEQGEKKKKSCIAFLPSVNNAKLGTSYKARAQRLMTLYTQQQHSGNGAVLAQ